MLDRLAIDLYEEDNHAPDMAAVKADGRFDLVVLKASEGLYYDAGKWFTTQWAAIKAAGIRFRGAYHFLNLGQSGTAQAIYFLGVLGRAGGLGDGDMVVVDVELGGSNVHYYVTAASVVKTVTDFVRHVKAVTGRKVVLYGAGAMRDLKITDRMACDLLWMPRYTATLPQDKVAAIGWDEESLLAWQYSDGATSLLPGYPARSPIGGDVKVLARRKAARTLRVGA